MDAASKHSRREGEQWGVGGGRSWLEVQMGRGGNEGTPGKQGGFREWGASLKTKGRTRRSLG